MEKYKKIFYAIFICIILLAGLIFYFKVNSQEVEVINLDKQDEEVKDYFDEKEIKEEKKIFVHIVGAVENEGVYELLEGSRIFEAIQLAGGLTNEAATDIVNQARELKDGELILFPTKEAVLNGEYKHQAEINSNGDYLININTADKNQLITLPGIGDAKASSIIKYRETNNGFKTIEDIMLIPGIKESIFQNIKDLITI